MTYGRGRVDGRIIIFLEETHHHMQMDKSSCRHSLTLADKDAYHPYYITIPKDFRNIAVQYLSQKYLHS